MTAATLRAIETARANEKKESHMVLSFISGFRRRFRERLNSEINAYEGPLVPSKVQCSTEKNYWFKKR